MWGSTTDPRGLQKVGGPDRIAAVWYNNGAFTVDVNLTDGGAHQLALYMADWDTTSRAEIVEVRDAVSNALLDARTISSFHEGQYWRWTVSGHVVFRFITTGGFNAVVNGLFLDALAGGSQLN